MPELPPYKEYVPENIPNATTTSDPLNPNPKKKRFMSPDHLLKMKLGRTSYWENQKKLKALEPEVNRISGELSEMTGSVGEIKKIESGMAREHIIRKIFSKKDKLLESQIDAATGLYMITADGKRTYQKPPNTATGEYLLNQLIGKPTESMEIKQITKLQVDI